MFRGLRIRWVRFCVNKLYAGTNVKHFEKKRKLLISIGYTIGEGTKIVGPIDCTGVLTIGNNCWIGKNFVVHGNGKVIIGDNCDVAPDVTILTGGHEIGNEERRAGHGYIKDVNIGAGCWICSRSTILAGVTVGQGVVIGACACVNKDVDNNTMVCGVPAKLIKRLD